ncbi:hypothetical protein IFR05_013859 [Cadophora sp. M221]|nr:hypothetical protein IFR05_013859 [Cadophora sp. M221]
MSVNPALHIALSHLRHSTEPRILWVDAVCINQEDLKEREEQVTQMRLVYSCARRVLAWLGEEYENSDAAMSLLENIDLVDLKKLQDSSGGDASPKRVDWDALFALLRRPWWSRVWIIQEVTVGESEPLVGCGNHWVSWSQFVKVDELFEQLEMVGADIVKEMDNPISRLRYIRAGIHGQLKTSWKNLFLLLRATHECQATDARDKVFALLGLGSDENQHAIHPDYTSSVVDVYTKVAKHLINLEDSLNVLIYFRPRQLPGLPSWVPDFSRSSIDRTHIGEAPSKGASGSSKPVVEFLTDGLSVTKLKARGWIVDVVRETSSHLYNPDDALASVRAMQQLALKTVPQSPTAKEEEELSERFWRCLVADSSLNYEFPAPDSFGRLFAVLCDEAAIPDDFEPQISNEKTRRDDYLYDLTSTMFSILNHARFFITTGGRLGVGPLETTAGDLTIILQGAGVPFLVRCNEHPGNEKIAKHSDDYSAGEGSDKTYTLVGEGYISGMKFGEMFETEAGENSAFKDTPRLSFEQGYQDLIIC